MIVGRDFFGRFAQCAELPTPQIGDGEPQVIPVIVPTVQLQSPITPQTGIVSPFNSDSCSRAAVLFSQGAGGPQNTVLVNLTKGVWRIHVTMCATIDVLAAGGLNGARSSLQIRPAASGGPSGTILGVLASVIFPTVNVAQYVDFADTVWMNRDFALVNAIDSVAGSTVSVEMSYMATRLF